MNLSSWMDKLLEEWVKFLMIFDKVAVAFGWLKTWKYFKGKMCKTQKNNVFYYLNFFVNVNMLK